jgi:hypothetical protein
LSVINARGITYAIGIGNDITASDMDEGINPYARPMITPVTDNTAAIKTFHSDPGVEIDDYQLGTVYYQATIPLLFRPANIRLLMDQYFEDTTAGGASAYRRDYYLDDIPNHPTDWLSLWKRSEEGGNDENEVYYGGLVHGVRFHMEERGVLKADFTASFCRAANDVAASGSWDSESGGDSTVWRHQDISNLIGPLGNVAGRKLSDFSISLHHTIHPNFYSEQYPERITRLGFVISGHFTLRDDSATTQMFLDAHKNSSHLVIYICNGSQYIRIGGVIIGYEEIFKNNTRYIKYNFSGVSGGSIDYGFEVRLDPDVA